MIEAIQQEESLLASQRLECDENKYQTIISSSIDRDRDLTIIKIDAYYGGLNLEKTPPTPDCLVVLRCEDGSYRIFIFELKNVNRASRIDRENIKDKFTTAVEDFMGKKFARIFENESFDIKDFRMYFITDPRGASSHNMKLEEFQKKYMGSRLDFLNNIPLLSYRGIARRIEHAPPGFTIEPC